MTTPATPDANGWFTIASAPKDGTRVDVWWHFGRGFRIVDVYWEPRYDCFFSDEEGSLDIHLTHYRHLPAPPVSL